MVGGQLLTMLKAQVHFMRGSGGSGSGEEGAQDLSQEEHDHVLEVWEDFGSVSPHAIHQLLAVSQPSLMISQPSLMMGCG